MILILRNLINFKVKVFFIIAFLFLSSCVKNTSEKTIDSEILVSAKYENGKVYIDAETEKTFKCINYSITNSIQRVEKTITVDFIEISILDICLVALGPAKAEMDLNELERGDYALKFVLDGIVTEAKLKVGSQLSLELIKAGNVKLK